MAFVRERGNVIDYEIPISGNLNDPKFHLRDAILDAVENIFVKPVTTNYSTKVRQVETEIEKSLSFKWEMRQSTISPKQEKFMNRLADFLKHNPATFVTVKPQPFVEKEKEYILFFEARKKYLLNSGALKQGASNTDLERINKLNIRDAGFIRYLNTQLTDSVTFTIQDKCASVVSPATLKSKFELLCDNRETAFMMVFKNAQVDKQVKIIKGKNEVPYNGFSVYKLNYEGELPKSLLKAYDKMNELNDASPRKKFKDERKGNQKSE